MKTKDQIRQLGLKSAKFLLFVAAGFRLLSSAAWAQHELFLHLDSPRIEGESTSPDHPNDIVATGFSFGVTNTLNAPCGRFLDLAITKFVDKASPLLMLQCASGNTNFIPMIQRMTLYVQKPVGGAPTDYLSIEFREGYVTGLTSGNTLNGQPTEVVTFRFARADMTYNQFNPDGTIGGTFTRCFNTQTCVSCSP